METGFSGERCLNLADLDHSFGCTAKEFCGLRQVSAGLGYGGAIPGRRDPRERSGALMDVLTLGAVHRGV